jgi:tetratricopeptide (TPR) repeat protein
MRNIIKVVTISCFLFSLPTLAQKKGQVLKNQSKKTAAQPRSASVGSSSRGQLKTALEMVNNGQYEGAANAFFSLARKPELLEERPQIKYMLSNMLIRLKLYQTAAFQLVDVIRLNHPKYSKLAITKLAIVADVLGDDTILNYAISRVDVNDIPAENKDMIHYRLGEIKNRNHEFDKAIELFQMIGPASSYYYQAQYSKALAELEANHPDQAIETLNKMIEARGHASITDTNKVEAQLALGRAYYQKKSWEESVEAYSKVPRDTVMWHDAVFEQSWAMLRAARFRSVLSNFQSLHSAYYEKFYMPESLLLRAIVYLYICKYDEMEKVLGLFETTYGPMRAKVRDFLHNSNDALTTYSQVNLAYLQSKGLENKTNLQVPYIALKYVLDQGDVKRSIRYLDKLAQEKNRIEGSSSLRTSSIGQYALKIILNRSNNTKMTIGEMARAHLEVMNAELHDLYEQSGFIRYEMINGRKENVKKKMAGKDISEIQIDDKMNRQFYIQNGFEYYPFQGEYWLDEIGNYHYLGKQSCE